MTIGLAVYDHSKEKARIDERVEVEGNRLKESKQIAEKAADMIISDDVVK